MTKVIPGSSNSPSSAASALNPRPGLPRARSRLLAYHPVPSAAKRVSVGRAYAVAGGALSDQACVAR